MTDTIYKAYSLLTEKAFEDGDSVIRGYATTPTPDRVADVVVPEGVVFRTRDIKLHLYHDTRLPVGQVSFGKPTSKGIPFEARIPEVTEEGIVRDRVNEAKHSIKYNLISAVSIGFRALQDGIEVLKTGGLKFTKWEMVELSLTSVPANPEAVFAAAKSMDPRQKMPEHMLRALKAMTPYIPGAAVSLVQAARPEDSGLPAGSVRLIR